MIRKKLIQRVALLCLVALLGAFLNAAEDHSALVGKWNMSSESDNGSVDWVLTIKDVDGKLTGVLVTDQGELPAKSFSYTDGVMQFLAPYEGEDYTIKLKQDGEKLVGTWSGSAGEGRTTGTRDKS
jgi:hypothetical protein